MSRASGWFVWWREGGREERYIHRESVLIVSGWRLFLVFLALSLVPLFFGPPLLLRRLLRWTRALLGPLLSFGGALDGERCYG